MNSFRLSAVGTALLVTGCQTTDVAPPPYPSHWAALETQAEPDFASLNGWYRDAGETSDFRASLTMVLFGFAAPWSDARRVSIRADAESMRVEVWSDDAHLYERTFSKSLGDYSWDQGNITISTHGKSVSEGYTGSFDGIVQLLTQKDLLILHEKSQYHVRGVLFPHSGSTETWYRFRKLPDKA